MSPLCFLLTELFSPKVAQDEGGGGSVCWERVLREHEGLVAELLGAGQGRGTACSVWHGPWGAHTFLRLGSEGRAVMVLPVNEHMITMCCSKCRAGRPQRHPRSGTGRPRCSSRPGCCTSAHSARGAVSKCSRRGPWQMGLVLGVQACYNYVVGTRCTRT